MTDQLNIGIRLALYANLMLLFGLPLFGLYALSGAERLQNAILPLRALTAWLSVFGIAFSVLGVAAMTASMAGVGMFDVDTDSISVMIFETPMGNAWVVRMFAMLSTLIAAFSMMGSNGLPNSVFVALGSGVALASLAWTGHGAAGEGSAGTAQLIADIIHLLSAGAWLGALAALMLMLFRNAKTMSQEYLRLTHRLLAGFSVAGTVIVTLVIGSGLVNGWVLVGPHNITTLRTTPYGQFLIAKLLLLAIMLVLAATNRFRLTPAFGRALHSGGTSAAVGKLRKSLALELGFFIIILGLVAWLGTLEPPGPL